MGVCCHLEAVQSNYFGTVPKLTESLERHVTFYNFISFQINFKLTYAILHLGLFCILHNINCLHNLHLAQVGQLFLACGKGEMSFPSPSSGLCGQYFASICTILLSSACTMDGVLGPSWLPPWSMQKVNKTHKGAELFP